MIYQYYAIFIGYLSKRIAICIVIQLQKQTPRVYGIENRMLGMYERKYKYYLLSFYSIYYSAYLTLSITALAI
jgi:hypothetical protein